MRKNLLLRLKWIYYWTFSVQTFNISIIYSLQIYSTQKLYKKGQAKVALFGEGKVVKLITFFATFSEMLSYIL